MKNFPHQYNDIAKLRGTLELTRDLGAAGKDVGNDGVLGYELAERLIYTFRGFDYESPNLPTRLATRIAAERRKPAGSQGARTAARDVRRTLVLLGWLDGTLLLTRRGGDLLATAIGSSEERDILVESLTNLSLTDSGGETSHPVLLLLRLIRDHAFASRDGMELALEATNDSDAEYRRLERLLDMPRSQRQSAIGVSNSQLANSVKIIPSLTEQAGMITRDASGRYVVTPAGDAALVTGYGSGQRVSPARQRPTVRPHTRISTAREVTQETAGSRRMSEARPRTAEEQIEATQLLVERTDRHQNLVKDLAGLLSKFKCFEDQYSYDLVAEPVPSLGHVLLWEVKTLREDASDAATQVRLAVGQLFFYEYFYVPLKWPGATVVRAAFLERTIPDELLKFLDEKEVAAFTHKLGALRALNDTARRIEPELS